MSTKMIASLEESIKRARAAQRQLLMALKLGDVGSVGEHRQTRDGWLDAARRRYIRDRKYA